MVMTAGKGAFLSPRGVGLAIAIATLAIDQANKLWLLFVYRIAEHQPVHVTGFFDIVFAKNPGISYSLLSATSAAGRWGLVALMLVATTGLAVWLYRSRTWFTACGLGLVIGGALGNAYDRFAYGFVADFYHFHLESFSWYIFNLADVAIVVGVGLLLVESVLMRNGAALEENAPTQAKQLK